MKVKDLIQALKNMPDDADVLHLWDGEPRTAIEHVWLARDGSVITADFNMVCYSNAPRPSDAPTTAEEPYWSTPRDPADADV